MVQNSIKNLDTQKIINFKIVGTHLVYNYYILQKTIKINNKDLEEDNNNYLLEKENSCNTGTHGTSLPRIPLKQYVINQGRGKLPFQL